MDCIVTGANREEFTCNLDRCLQEAQAEFDQSLVAVNPTVACHTLVSAVKDAAQVTFVSKPSTDAKRESYCRLECLREPGRVKSEARAMVGRVEGKIQLEDVPPTSIEVASPQLKLSLSLVVKSWLAQVRPNRANTNIKRAFRQHRKEHTQRLEHEISELWRDREMAPAWRSVRQAARVQKGAKRKWANCPISSQPTLSQTMGVLAAGPREGGWNATLVDQSPEGHEMDIYTRQIQAAEHSAHPCHNIVECSSQARQDLFGTLRALKRAPNRRGVPFWSVPGEVWKIIIAAKVFKTTKHGLGYRMRFEHRSCERVKSMLLRAFDMIRVTRSLLRQFGMSQGVRVLSNESSEKVGSDSRIVHAFCSLAKAYVKNTMSRAKSHSPAAFESVHAYGTVPGRRREHAISVQNIMQHRVARSGYCSMLRLYDIKSVFCSPNEESKKETLWRPSQPCESELLLQHAGSHVSRLSANEGQALVCSCAWWCPSGESGR